MVNMIRTQYDDCDAHGKSAIDKYDRQFGHTISKILNDAIRNQLFRFNVRICLQIDKFPNRVFLFNPSVNHKAECRY